MKAFSLRELGSTPLDRAEPNALSPRVDEGFRGIVLAEPPLLPSARDWPFPVIGTYRVSARFASGFRSLHNETVVVVVDQKTHAPRVTSLLRPGHLPVESRFDETAPGFDEIAMTGWFNLDLYNWMEDLPRAKGAYWVYAVAGELVSNVVRVEILGV